jgi:hypothetical protein
MICDLHDPYVLRLPDAGWQAEEPTPAATAFTVSWPVPEHYETLRCELGRRGSKVTDFFKCLQMQNASKS